LKVAAICLFCGCRLKKLSSFSAKKLLWLTKNFHLLLKKLLNPLNLDHLSMCFDHLSAGFEQQQL